MAYYKPITGGPTNEPSPGVIERALTFLIDCDLRHKGLVRTTPVTFTKRTPEEMEELPKEDLETKMKRIHKMLEARDRREAAEQAAMRQAADGS